jgi:pimeloyl-ACP methyl ester carboxylesterase
MVLSSQSWGQADAEAVVCVHGIAQRGSIFSQLGERLAAAGHFVAAVDLRGHGDSGRLPPWDTDTHVGDLLDTVGQLGVERVTWVGHSFGGRLAAAAAAERPELTQRLVLLDSASEVPAEAALRSAEIERLDWSFATRDGAANAVLSSKQMASRPDEAVAAYAAADLRKGPDGRLRFSFSPSAVVVAWSEMVLSAPPIAPLPTLIVRPEVPFFDATTRESRYRDALGGLLTTVTVPNGHNVLWEAPEETISAIEGFLGRAA